MAISDAKENKPYSGLGKKYNNNQLELIPIR